jgi:hypothetical protein
VQNGLLLVVRIRFWFPARSRWLGWVEVILALKTKLRQPGLPQFVTDQKLTWKHYTTWAWMIRENLSRW